MVSSGAYTYTYDGYNRRVISNDSKGTSYSFYDASGQLLLRETQEGLTSYVFMGKKMVAKHKDYTEAPKPAGDSKMHYKPFGDSIEAPKDDVGYTGHKFDTDLGLSYMQARYYDPVIGRFYSNDLVDFTSHLNTETGIQGFNRYLYVNNNPYKYTDPDGKALCGGICVIGIGIGVGMLFDAATEAIRGEDNSTGNTAGNAASGGAFAATGPFADKPRGGIAGGGPAGTKTSVASKANHKAAKDGKISKKTSHKVTKVLRKVPYVGIAIAVAQLVDAVVDRVESETSNETSNQDRVGNKEMENQQ